MKILEFLNHIQPKSPVCCFGARVAPLGLLQWASNAGNEISSQGRTVVSGGAKGIDSAFVKNVATAETRIFLPDYNIGKVAPLIRSKKALEFAKSCNGGAIVVLSYEAFESQSGGSFYSLTQALKLNMPVLRVLFSNSDNPDLSFKIFLPQLELF